MALENKLSGIAGSILLAISFCALPFAQNNEPHIILHQSTTPCATKTGGFIETNSETNLRLTLSDSLLQPQIKKIKVKSKQLNIGKPDLQSQTFSANANKPGIAMIKTVVVLEDGTKLNQTCELNVVDLPELEVEITVTSPDAKFMWLNLIDKNTRQSANSSFNLCQISFELTDSSGMLKEKGLFNQDNDYFPSVTLSELPNQFKLNDRLTLAMIVTHYEYHLPVYINQVLVIEKLWN